jgi:hypothetical protein
MMVMTAREILTVLYNNIIEGLARYGCGVMGLPFYEEESSADLPLSHDGCARKRNRENS